MSVTILRADARMLPLADESVDLIVSSPPYWSLRAYQDNGETYDGQIGAEATPGEFVDALIDCTREWMRVLKPSGSIWVNLGDKYATAGTRRGNEEVLVDSDHRTATHYMPRPAGFPNKSLMLLPERYRIRAVDELGLIARAVVIWSKPNGLPESVTDRVRRSHEDWVHLTKQPRYYSAVDEIREEYSPQTEAWQRLKQRRAGEVPAYTEHVDQVLGGGHTGLNDRGSANPLGKLPGSVWTIATEPLRVPDHLGIDHFAAFPTEFPRRIITGWSPREVCTACGEGRRPVSVALGESARDRMNAQGHNGYTAPPGQQLRALDFKGGHAQGARARELTGYDCACPDTSAPATPGVVLDVFGGTGTTALVADVLGRDGITVDLSADYCRLAEWRTTDPKQRAKAARVEAVEPVSDNQPDLFGGAA